MKKYESYQASSVGWLGDIPKHWDCLKVGSLFSQRNTKVSDRDYAPLSVTKNGVVPQLATAAKSNDNDNRKLVRIGDFVINSRSDRKGSCGVSDFDGSVSLINIVLEPRQEWNGRYVHYLLRSQPFSEEFYRWGRGIVADLWTTRYSEMKNILLPVPPQAEQDQIVRFLDWKTSRINRLINVYKKEIAYVLELKKAIISQTVTHGLNLNAQMRDSGISWLGDVPAHWKLLRLKRVLRERKENNFPVKTRDILSLTNTRGVIPYAQKGNIGNRHKENIEDYHIAHPNDLVLNCMNVVIGSVGISKYYGAISPVYYALYPRGDENIRYFGHIFSLPTFEETLKGLGNGIMEIRRRIPMIKLNNVVLPVPPRTEQDQIVEFLDKKASAFQRIIDIQAKRIELLKEYKNRLISDVVTGQIDVRDVEIPEYERVEEIAGSNSEDDEAELEEAESEVE